MKDKRLKLWLPDQVKDEFERNRDGKIHDALKRVREQRLNLQFPAICRDYDDYEVLRKLQHEYEARHAALLTRIVKDVEDENLHADAVIGELFDEATAIPTTEALLLAARRRVELGNPPGKSGSIGDALNWEALLDAVPNNEDIFFVTQDADYSSPLDGEQFNSFLLAEWHERKASLLHFYRQLSHFFKEHYPKITLASEAEKDLLITDLANSPNFARTHTLIARLNQQSDFAQSQVEDIVDAVLSNNQVRWIAPDLDVKEFLTKLLDRYGEWIEAEKRQKIEEATARF